MSRENDEDHLNNIDLDIRDVRDVQDILDTQILSTRFLGKIKPGLKHLLDTLKVPARNLHNGGNDSAYTSFIFIIVPLHIAKENNAFPIAADPRVDGAKAIEKLRNTVREVTSSLYTGVLVCDVCGLDNHTRIDCYSCCSICNEWWDGWAMCPQRRGSGMVLVESRGSNLVIARRSEARPVPGPAYSASSISVQSLDVTETNNFSALGAAPSSTQITARKPSPPPRNAPQTASSGAEKMDKPAKATKKQRWAAFDMKD